MLTIYIVPAEGKQVTYRASRKDYVTTELNSDSFRLYLSGNTTSRWSTYFSRQKRFDYDEKYNLDILITQTPHLFTGLYWGSPGEGELFHLINEDFRFIDAEMVRIAKEICQEFKLDDLIWQVLEENIGEKVVCIYHSD